MTAVIRLADARLQRVDADQQFHQIVVGRIAGRLEHEHILAADILVDLDEDLLVGEAAHQRLGERQSRDNRRSRAPAAGSNCRSSVSCVYPSAAAAIAGRGTDAMLFMDARRPLQAPIHWLGYHEPRRLRHKPVHSVSIAAPRGRCTLERDDANYPRARATLACAIRIPPERHAAVIVGKVDIGVAHRARRASPPGIAPRSAYWTGLDALLRALRLAVAAAHDRHHVEKRVHRSSPVRHDKIDAALAIGSDSRFPNALGCALHAAAMPPDTEPPSHARAAAAADAAALPALSVARRRAGAEGCGSSAR